MRCLRLAAALLALASIAACSSDEASSAAPVAPLASEAPPARDTLWLCRPGLSGNPCEGGLDATVVDGSNRVEPFEPAASPAVDCFYVYPTVSQAVSLNAPLEVDDTLVAVARAQAARFGEVCRVFAPVYRQLTLSAIFTGRYDDPSGRATAEGDVLAAWQDYLANDNDGRPVVLLGHSQGARTLTWLLAGTIEPDPEQRDLLLSALLIGADVTVPQGGDVGGSFTQVPACREPGQTGCVVAYSSYAEEPPSDAVFGRTALPGQQVLCTDPSLLGGVMGALDPYLPTAALSGGSTALSSVVPGVATGFVTYPGQLTASCRDDGGTSHLRVALAPGARLGTPEQALGPRWGLHNGDVNLALGDLVEIVRRQAG